MNSGVSLDKMLFIKSISINRINRLSDNHFIIAFQKTNFTIFINSKMKEGQKKKERKKIDKKLVS